METFPENVECDNEMLEATAGSEPLLRTLWNHFPSLQNEFPDFESFKIFARSVADGRTIQCGGLGKVTVSKGI